MSLILTSMALALMFACAPAVPPARSGSNATSAQSPTQPATPARGDSLVHLYRSDLSGIHQPARRVIADSASWAQAWAQAQSRGSVSAALPAVDFSRFVVIIAALGDQPSTGYGITVDSVARKRSEYLIFVRTSDPGDCIVGGLVTQPVDVVAVPRSALPPQFVETHISGRC
jgi:hypothetical protein